MIKDISNIKIHEAGLNDYRAIYELQMKAYATENELYDYTIPPLLQSFDDALNDMKSRLVLKAVAGAADTGSGPCGCGEIIVGSVRGYKDEEGACQITKLMVEPGWRNLGIGTALLKEIESRFPGCIYKLFTGTKSHGNIRLYMCNGYKLYRTNDEDELVYLCK